ncbi:helix-turn-helix transcriptional regulator [Thalassiella azotivora]
MSPAPAGAADRLSRLLALVPYLTARQGVPLAEAARHFDITEDQLVADLQLLFVCGTPGHMPDDLIDAEWESGRVYLTNADAIARPLRLGLDEAVALLAGLRTLAEARGVGDSEALDSARAKLSAAAGDAARAADAVRVDLSTGAAADVLTTCRDALRRRRRVHLRYLVTARDEATERDVDPMRLVSADGRWYLEAWCHRVEDVRLFRLDRVLSADVLDVDGTPPAGAVGRDLDDALFRPGPDDTTVTLELGPAARWVAEYYPVESTEEAPGDVLRVRLRTADPGWLRRLLLRLGGAARVVHPPELATRTREVALQALAAYADDPDDPVAGPREGPAGP